ncbi:MAG: type II toxin-antitoxin system RelE/ParE family toxin [Clostridiales Family XIII bacterium]|jgi:hypothetical protein|nr:type II toxin-antitoxin system RelE/ParE family toxin [Clostridiales Family XIII bacterium]
MTNLRYSDSAAVDLLAAIKTIWNYFIEKDSPELGDLHIEKFQTELKRKEELLRQNPQLFPTRREYSSKYSGRAFRSFTVHWFTVFYTYEENEGIVFWYIRSSVSDFSTLILLS